MLNAQRMQTQANLLHAKAANGTLKIDGHTYTLTFTDGAYDVTCPTNPPEYPLRFNTRKLTVARKWLREYV